MQNLMHQFSAAKTEVSSFDLTPYQPLFEKVVQQLAQQNMTITAAESLTAGLFQATLASVSGASQVLSGGFVTYSLEMKSQLLQIDAQQLRDHGVVSSWTAEQMATNSSQVIGSDWGVGLTGVAGPQTLEGQAAGTVFISVKSPQKVVTQKFNFGGQRDAIRKKSVVAAFFMLVNEL